MNNVIIHENDEGKPKCGAGLGEEMSHRIDQITCPKCRTVDGQVRLTSITLRRALRLCLHESGGDLCTRRAGHDGLHEDLEVGIGWKRAPDDDCAPVE